MFGLGWKDMCIGIEIELSLTYDIRYTKAAVIYTWHGYTIRVFSLISFVAALLLFLFSNEDGSVGTDVVIIRIVLAATFLLETASLLRALGSSWTIALLYRTRRWGWLRHAVLCTRRCHWFHRVVVKVEGYRGWSGKIGQLNLLHFCTSPQHSNEGGGGTGVPRE